MNTCLGDGARDRARCLLWPTLLVLAACSAHEDGTATAGSPSTGVPDAGHSGSFFDSGLPENAKQYTFSIESFEVPANTERYECQDVPNPFGKDIAIIKTESNMSMGAHHMFAFQIPATEAAFTPDAGLYAAETPAVAPDDGGVPQTFAANGAKTPLFDCPEGGLEFHPFFVFVQDTRDAETYPAGVGRSLKNSEAIRLNVHYLNASAAPIRVNAEVTVTYVDVKAVKQIAAGIFVFANSLQVPMGISTQTFAYQVPVDMKFLQFMGHMHSRGTYFEARTIAGATGEVRPLYSSNTCNEPPTLNFAPAVEMKKGDSVWYSCTFDNHTGGVLTFGESASTNEMCNFFGVFYPAVNGSGLLGQL
jgi:hypothetical protein